MFKIKKVVKKMYILLCIKILITFGIFMLLFGFILKNKRLKLIGLYSLTLLIIFVVIFGIYTFSENNKEFRNKVGTLVNNEYFKNPDRIIYKNQKGFFIIEPQDEEYDFICTELDKRVTSNSDGKVISEDDLIRLKETESFIEFDYNKDSKNRIFFLEKKDYGMLKMLEKDGQIVKPNLDNLKDLKKKIDSKVKNNKIYEMSNIDYYSNNKITEIPKEYLDRVTGSYFNVYHFVIKDQDDYTKFYNAFRFDPKETTDPIYFDTQNVIVTITKANIESTTVNIGNVRFKFNGEVDYGLDGYNVSILVVSKVVNSNCIYDDVKDVNSKEPEIDYSHSNVRGVIKSIKGNEISLGYPDGKITDIVEINNIEIENSFTNEKVGFNDLKIGDSVLITGKIISKENGITKTKADTIKMFPKENLKLAIENQNLKDTYRIDGYGIIDYNIDSSGNGYIICELSFDNFVYPVMLNVTSKTETFLGSYSHLKSNYGYVLHEMCFITMDTKVTDIDNIKGKVNTIEYIAD